MWEEHPEAFDYDWRTRFGLPASVIGTSKMDWRESWSLTRSLLSDGSSRLGAAVAGWDKPWPVEAWILADIWDVLAVANSKRKPSPYDRPNSNKRKRIGRASLPQTQIISELRKRAPSS